MAVSRANSVVDQQTILGMYFYINGSLADIYQMINVDVKDSGLEIIETIPSGDIRHPSLGYYEVTAAAISTAGSYSDHWNFVSVEGAASGVEIGSFNVYTVAALAEESWQLTLQDRVWKLMGENTPSGTEMYETLSLAAQEVVMDVPEINNSTYNSYGPYTMETSTGAISPNPLSDTDFCNLIVRKTASIIKAGSAALGASQSIRIRSGEESVDASTGAMTKTQLYNEFERAYQLAKRSYILKTQKENSSYGFTMVTVKGGQYD